MDIETPYPDTLGPNAREIYAELCRQLPLLDHKATPEEYASRDRRAMKAVVALHPNDDFEARLATRIVAMDAQAAHCLHRASRLDAGDFTGAASCRAQAASMARQSDSALRALRRMQAERDKAFAAMHPAEMRRAGYWFREVGVPDPEPQPAAPPPAEAEFQPTDAQIDADAALYEIMYPRRVTRILAAGGLPPDLDFGPPDAKLVAALLRRARHPAPASHGVRPGLSNARTETDAGHDHATPGRTCHVADALPDQSPSPPGSAMNRS